MAIRLVYSVIFALLVLFDTSCTNEINIQQAGPVVEEGQVGGSISLPAGIKIDTAGLKVFSALKSTTPVNSSYAVDTAGKTSTTLLMNKNGDIVLMGYNYPGQTESDLSPASTALAMLMNSLMISSLTTEGRVDAIQKIKAEPAFNAFVDEVSAVLQAGKSVTDTTNTSLFRSMAAVFNDVTNLRTAAVQSYDKPITIKTANTELLLQNSYVSHTYVAGIYKDGKNLARLTIDGRRIFATSLTDAVMGKWGDGYGMPDPVMYSMADNGEYSVVIRSGKPSEGDDSEESKLARRQNVYFFMLNLVLDHLPIRAGCLKTTAQGIQNLSKSLVEKKELVLKKAKSPQEFAIIALELAGEMFALSNEAVLSCSGLTDQTNFFTRGLGRLFRCVSVASKFMVLGNVMSHTNDLFQARAAMDTCFQVIGLRTFRCGEQPTYLVSSADGDKQTGEAGKELEKPLKVKVTDDDERPAGKAKVVWIVRSGGGSVSNITSETNNEGFAEMKWKLGAAAAQQVEAYVNKKTESKSAMFTANVAVASAFKVEIISKNASGNFYTNPIKVRVTDASGNPLPQVELNWAPESGVRLTNFEQFTNYDGIAQASIVLTGGKIAMQVAVKNDDSKSVTFSPQQFVSGVPYDLFCFIDINDNRESLPNPFKLIFVDKHLIPFPGLDVIIGPANSNSIDGSGTNERGEMTVTRNNPSITQYRLNINVNGQTIASWANIIIK
ncbi:hypothetical protein DYBT9623_04500 [Dyadobacter sp. CECT 9623]|uniref:Big-1 domain-containing protein n=2 Tax=Dyadobacter linearis TaxID=2823330 RepID=A0ABM8UW38_9BACT|nr:hypothetical protein DYBT9623_04500 [Dyadobacter sp. CECT 9623]